ncbi:MAG: hypothetical protein LC624_12650 [Halobacteriales archaeon]|nr:hypothetical protein [Halobacteriales archaeon]
MSPRVLPEEEAQAWVRRALAAGPRTTRDLDEQARGEGVTCPDGTARFLARLHRRGIVAGELAVAERTWRWWLP